MFKIALKLLILPAIVGFIFISQVAWAGDNIPDQQLSCLAETIFREARGQTLMEKIRVGNVVMNRTHHKRFPSTPCDVLHQSGQFPWVVQSLKERFKTIRNELDEYDNCVGIARNIMNGSIKDNTNSALFFHANDGEDWDWPGLRILFTTKAHIYYTFNKN